MQHKEFEIHISIASALNNCTFGLKARKRWLGTWTKPPLKLWEYLIHCLRRQGTVQQLPMFTAGISNCCDLLCKVTTRAQTDRLSSHWQKQLSQS